MAITKENCSYSSQMSMDKDFSQLASRNIGFIPRFHNTSSHDAVFVAHTTAKVEVLSNCQ